MSQTASTMKLKHKQ